VEPGDGIRKLGHEGAGQPALLGHSIEKVGLVEPPHDHGPFDGLAIASQGEARLARAGYCEGVQIKAGRGAAIECDFPLAGPFPVGEGREIHVGKLHGALDLVSAGACQENHGTVRVEAFHRLAAVGGRVLQERRDLTLVRHLMGAIRKHLLGHLSRSLRFRCL
jgi:hypothetical protein